MTEQLERLTDLKADIEELEDRIRDKSDPDKADLEQLQALDSCKRDLKRAGAHIGRAGAGRYLNRVAERLEGIRQTWDL